MGTGINVVDERIASGGIEIRRKEHDTMQFSRRIRPKRAELNWPVRVVSRPHRGDLGPTQGFQIEYETVVASLNIGGMNYAAASAEANTFSRIGKPMGPGLVTIVRQRG